MLQTCLAINLIICCLIAILKLGILDALPIRLDVRTEGSLNGEDYAKNSTTVGLATTSAYLEVLTEGSDYATKPTTISQEFVGHTLAFPSHKSENLDGPKDFTESGKVSAKIEALPALENSGVRKERSMGALPSKIRLNALNASHPQEAVSAYKRSRTRKPKKPKSKNKGRVKVGAKGDDPEPSTAAEPFVPPKELTIAVPKFKTDSLGRWVYNPWGATFGKVWKDTRFQLNHQSRMPRLRVDSYPVNFYYSDNEKISSVCPGRSTVYNRPPVNKYLNIKLYKEPHSYRPIFMQLRRVVYAKGKSEECHNKNYSSFLAYQNCALRRNQRMEYILPRYPATQL